MSTQRIPTGAATLELRFACPVGVVRVAARDGAVVQLFLEDEDALGPPSPSASAAGEDRGGGGAPGAGSDPVLVAAREQLLAWFAGERTGFDLPLRPAGTPFQRAVWEELCAIPYGETRSYGWIAARLGRSSACRAVGAANGRNPIAVVVPCHRVIGSTGGLTGYAGGVERKRWLLDHERAVLARRTGEAPREGLQRLLFAGKLPVQR